jgi:hypothetical protein
MTHVEMVEAQVRGLSVAALRRVAAQRCANVPGAVYPVECCSSCEAKDRLAYRLWTREVQRREFRQYLRGRGPRPEGIGSIY